MGSALRIALVLELARGHLVVGQAMGTHELANLVLGPANEGIDLYEPSLDIDATVDVVGLGVVIDRAHRAAAGAGQSLRWRSWNERPGIFW
jgi:hypothetical protein